MDKATSALKRSSTKLRGLSTKYSDLQVIIGQLGDQRTAFKSFVSAQQTACDDIVRWSNTCENRGIQETISYLSELSLLWTEVQKDFSERLREFKTLFELLREGERHVDQSRDIYSFREQREIKSRKELQKGEVRGAGEELKLMQERVTQAERGKELAYQEVVGRMKENEAVKLIRFREGLRKVSSGYVLLGERCQAVFRAYHDVASLLPDSRDLDIQNLAYSGSREAAASVSRAKQQVLSGYASTSAIPSRLYAATAASVERDVERASAERGGSISKPRVDMPEDGKGRTSKEEEAAKDAAFPSSPSHDPPPSYSSVFGRAEASGGEEPTKTVQNNAEIQIKRSSAYPSLDSNGGGGVPPSAPVGLEARGTIRADSDVRSGVYAAPESLLSNLQLQDGQPPAGIYDTTDTRPAVILPTDKRGRKLSMKNSFSMAGSAITGMFGGANSAYKRHRRHRADWPDSEAPTSMDYEDVGPPTTDQTARHVTNVPKETQDRAAEKHRALSAKFVLPSSDFREELSPPSCVTSQHGTMTSQHGFMTSHNVVKKRARKRKTSDGSSSRGSRPPSQLDTNDVKNAATSEQNLIDLNVSVKESSNNAATQLLLREFSSQADDRGLREANTKTDESKLGTAAPQLSLLDGDLAELAQPRGNARNKTNPFLDGSESESESSR